MCRSGVGAGAGNNTISRRLEQTKTRLIVSVKNQEALQAKKKASCQGRWAESSTLNPSSLMLVKENLRPVSEGEN